MKHSILIASSTLSSKKGSFFLVFALFLGNLSLSAQTWTNYTIANTRNSDSLISNHIRAIAVDSQNNKWVATDIGVAKFDGTRWTSYTKADGLINDDVYSVAIDAQGNVWFGTFAGISKFDGVKWQNYLTPAGTGSVVFSIAVDKRGNKWFGTNAGLAKFDDTKWTAFTTLEGATSMTIRAILAQPNGDIWVGTYNTGVIKFDGATWTRYDAGTVISMAMDAQNNLWMGSFSGISKFDGYTTTKYRLSTNELGNVGVNAIAIDNQGNKFLGINGGGLVQLNEPDLVTIGLKGLSVNALVIDKQGNKWMGGTGGSGNSLGGGFGVANLTGANWTIHRATGLFDASIYALAIDAQGNKWFGSSYNGVFKFDGKKWTNYNSSDGLIYNSVYSIAIDAQNNKWFGTLQGVSKFDGTTWTNYLNTGNFMNKATYSIAIDNQDIKWFGTQNGVIKFDGTNYTDYLVDNSGANKIASIAVDAQDTKWFGTESSLTKFDNTNWTVYPLALATRRPVAIDNQGNKWTSVGNVNNVAKGLFTFNGSTWTSSYTTVDGLLSNTILSIKIDADNNKWVGTPNGVSKLGTSWTNYQAAPNGLINNTINAIGIDAQGNKWFCTEGGVSRFGTAITGVQDVKNDLNLTIFPNPFSTIITLKFEENTPSLSLINGNLTVVNTLGQMVHQEKITTNSVQLNTQLWAVGTYIVSAKINGALVHKQLVKVQE
jgi:ligand-binding sensor domain-containing protein